MTDLTTRNRLLIGESTQIAFKEMDQWIGCNTIINKIWHKIIFNPLKISNTISKSNSIIKKLMISHTWPNSNNLSSNSNQVSDNNILIWQQITRSCNKAQLRIHLKWLKIKILAQKAANTSRHLIKMPKRESKGIKLVQPTLFISKKIICKR